MIIELKVQPNSGKNEILEQEDGTLKIKLKSPPVENSANKELIELLSKKLKVPKSQIKIINGQTSKFKRIEIPDIANFKELLLK